MRQDGLKQKRRELKQKQRSTRANSLSQTSANEEARKEKRPLRTKDEEELRTESERAAKYERNLVDSDDSSDEEVLLRTGNVPMKWYAPYDHQGYSVKGQAL